MKTERQTGRRFVVNGETITTRRVADGDKLAKVLGIGVKKKSQSRKKYSKEIESLASYMVRGFHDWFNKDYYLEPGFRSLIGKRKKVITVNYLALRDDWEDDCLRAFEAWEKLGFDFKPEDPEKADIVVDDEKKGAYALRRFSYVGRKHGRKPIIHAVAREINIWKEWKEWSLYDAILHEIGHTLGLGHPGPYNGSRPPQANPNDTSSNTIMSYYGGIIGKLGDADRLAIDMIYG